MSSSSKLAGGRTTRPLLLAPRLPLLREPREEPLREVERRVVERRVVEVPERPEMPREPELLVVSPRPMNTEPSPRPMKPPVEVSESIP